MSETKNRVRPGEGDIRAQRFLSCKKSKSPKRTSPSLDSLSLTGYPLGRGLPPALPTSGKRTQQSLPSFRSTGSLRRPVEMRGSVSGSLVEEPKTHLIGLGSPARGEFTVLPVTRHGDLTHLPPPKPPKTGVLRVGDPRSVLYLCVSRGYVPKLWSGLDHYHLSVLRCVVINDTLITSDALTVPSSLGQGTFVRLHDFTRSRYGREGIMERGSRPSSSPRLLQEDVSRGG